MKILLVEDDFLTRRILQSFLQSFGTCDITVNGLEAMKAFILAIEEKEPYDLICLDLLMPEMDGEEALKEIRKLETEHGIDASKAVKVILISILGDVDRIQSDLRNECEAFIAKPIEKQKLIDTLNDLGLIQ